jgi:hypothetical protein
MRKQISVILVLLLSIYLLDNVITFNVDRLPKSKPTPVEQFMDRIAEIESDGNHRVVNRYGMMGKYQFAPSTVRMLGFRVSQQQFLKDPELQDTVMFRYMKENYRELRNLIERYDGKTRHGIRITRAGILAGAHFAGSEGVRQYLLSSTDPDGITDGNGTTIRTYMRHFSDFSLPPLKL